MGKGGGKLPCSAQVLLSPGGLKFPNQGALQTCPFGVYGGFLRWARLIRSLAVGD